MYVPQAQVVTINSMGLRQLERTERNTRMRHKDKINEPVNGGFQLIPFLQVSGEGLSNAELDRAASESTKCKKDPDSQPGRGNHVRVSGCSPNPSPLLCTHYPQPPLPTPFRPPNVIVVSFSDLLAFKIHFQIIGINEYGDGMMSQIVEARTKGKKIFHY